MQLWFSVRLIPVRSRMLNFISFYFSKHDLRISYGCLQTKDHVTCDTPELPKPCRFYSLQIANGWKKARLVRQSWQGSNPRRLLQRSRVCPHGTASQRLAVPCVAWDRSCIMQSRVGDSAPTDQPAPDNYSVAEYLQIDASIHPWYFILILELVLSMNGIIISTDLIYRSTF